MNPETESIEVGPLRAFWWNVEASMQDYRREGWAWTIVNRLPKKVVLMCFCRVMAHAWAEAGDKHPNEVTYEEAYARWKEAYGE